MRTLNRKHTDQSTRLVFRLRNLQRNPFSSNIGESHEAVLFPPLSTTATVVLLKHGRHQATCAITYGGVGQPEISIEMNEPLLLGMAHPPGLRDSFKDNLTLITLARALNKESRTPLLSTKNTTGLSRKWSCQRSIASHAARNSSSKIRVFAPASRKSANIEAGSCHENHDIGSACFSKVTPPTPALGGFDPSGGSKKHQ